MITFLAISILYIVNLIEFPMEPNSKISWPQNENRIFNEINSKKLFKLTISE